MFGCFVGGWCVNVWNQQTEQIFVATNEIGPGAPLDAQNVHRVEWPITRIPVGSVRDLDELEAKYTRARLHAGEPVLRAMLMDSIELGSESLGVVPKDFRVVSVPIEWLGSELVNPGDRVGLVVEVPGTSTRIQHDVNVLCVDSVTVRREDSEGRRRNTRMVTLAVKPELVEVVFSASKLGKLRLTSPSNEQHIPAP